MSHVGLIIKLRTSIYNHDQQTHIHDSLLWQQFNLTNHNKSGFILMPVTREFYGHTCESHFLLFLVLFAKLFTPDMQCLFCMYKLEMQR